MVRFAPDFHWWEPDLRDLQNEQAISDIAGNDHIDADSVK